MLFALTAVACGVVLAGNYRTLAFALLLFDATAAVFALNTRHPGRADFGELTDPAITPAPHLRRGGLQLQHG